MPPPTSVSATSQPPPTIEERARLAGIYTHRTLAQLNTKPKAAVIEGLFYERTVNLCVGHSGIGKTPFLVGMGVAIAAGVPWLGRATKRGPVLYYDVESQSGDFRELQDRCSRHLGLCDVPLDFYVFNPNWADQSPEDWQHTVAKHVALLRPTLVFIDPLRGLWPDAESETKLAAQLINELRAIGRDHGTAFTILHHRRKPQSGNTKHTTAPTFSDPMAWLMEAAGAHALVNQTDTRLGIQRSEDLGDDGLDINGLIRGQGPMTPFTVTREHDEHGEPVGYAMRTGTRSLGDRAAAVYAVLGSTFRWRDVKLAVETQLKTTSDRTVKAIIDECLAAQVIHRDGVRGDFVYTKRAPSGGSVEVKAA